MLRPASHDHLRQIMPWFPDQRSGELWGGPRFRFPFTEATFLEDSRLGAVPSFVLTEGEAVVGFGQYYLRAGRCHLGRLAISPAHRGQGLGRVLIVELVRFGVEDLGVAECSLFVADDNLPALRLYEKLGFVRAEYPEDDPAVRHFTYMVVSAQRLSSPSP